MHTVSEIARRLAEYGSYSPTDDALTLVSFITNKSRSSLLAERNSPLPEEYSHAIDDALAKRSRHIPLQYILGEWEFWGMRFYVDESCLIPRPDTEILVSAALDFLNKYSPRGAKILDLCTGSGCIAAAILHSRHDPADRAVLADISEDALETARKNLRLHSLADKASVMPADVREDFLPPDELFDAVTANPPYIAADEMPSLAPELSHEPKIALTDGGDGLSLIRAVVANFSRHLKKGGRMFIEHGCAQKEAAARIAEEYGMAHEVIRDYGGNDRCTVLRKADGESEIR